MAATVPAVGGREALLEALASLEPGVTEITLHPAVDSPELRAATGDWASRVADLALLVDDPEVAAALAASGATRIGYRPLRDAMRHPDPAVSHGARARGVPGPVQDPLPDR